MHRQQQQPPFRVLSPGGRILYEPQAVLRSPPPSRAPEPYKVAPQATSYGRTQRKSSFAIIAETRPPSPLGVASRPGSAGQQIPGSGRVSPFRGRGFKGPPPGSRSRPHTPTDEEEEEMGRRTGRSRYDRRASISQQNSPHRSQIPRPARSRSISASKENLESPPHKPSPKFGRRAATNRYTSSIGNNNVNNRRTVQSNNVKNNNRSTLSPIQGTPTKFAADNNRNRVSQVSPPKAAPRSFGTQRTNLNNINRSSPQKINRNLLAPPKNVPPKRFITAKTNAPSARDKSASSEALDSPSKIPLRRGSVTSGSTPALNSKSTNKLTAAASRDSLNKASSEDQSGRNSEPFKVISSNLSDGSGNSSSTKDTKSQPATDEDLGLVDLLKQSSGATGTSSVVNTTTTTAVQPLQIDAASILAEGELVAKLTSLERKQNEENAQKSSAAAGAGAKKSENEAKTKPAAGEQQQTGGNSKNGNMTQTMIKHFGPNAGNEEKNAGNSGGMAEAKVAEGAAATQAKVAKGAAATQAEVEKPKDEAMKSATEDQEKQRQGSTTAPTGHKKTDSKASNSRSSTKSNSTSNADAKKPSPASRNSSAKNEQTTEDATQKNETRTKRSNGAGNALAAGGSNESLSSLRSTDTGVSVNTVRGVSSAKEKSGLHMVKRPEEIETLSGNIVHLDRNGEHAASNNAEEAAASTAAAASGGRLQRLKNHRLWKRLTGAKPGAALGKREAAAAAAAAAAGGAAAAAGARGCWPKMRCLACRRDPKAQLWPGKQARGASTTQLTPNARDKPSRWARIKDACRCAKLREARICNWRRNRRMQQQVAPSEQAASKSCKPALGGLCRRLFSSCSCGSLSCRRRRQSDQSTSHGRSVRAKHSLTSVAAPPLSEETRAKIPDVLIEHNSVMRGAIPCLPVPIAWFCLILNVVAPGTGTVFSGLFNLCLGQPRFSATASPKARFGALIVDIIVGVSQLFTVLFCLVGWGWSIWWGVTMVRLARKYKRFKDSEAAANDPEARGGPETATLPAPGVPAQALRGMERAR